MARWVQFFIGGMVFPALPLALLYLHQSNVSQRYDARLLVALPDVWMFLLSFSAAVVMDIVSEPCQSIGQVFFIVGIMVVATIAACEYGEMLALESKALNVAYWTFTELWVAIPAIALAVGAKALQKERVESSHIRGYWR